METLATFAKSAAKSCLIVKKGNKYLAEKNGEFVLSAKQSDAIVFTSEKQLKSIIDNATIDTRNARVIGKSYGIVPITKPNK